MQQRLQGPASPGVRVDVKLFRHQRGHDSGGEVVLIGESGDGQTLRLRALGQAGPIDVRGDIGVANLGKR